MLKAGLIEKAPPNTRTAAPFFFVWKKDGSRRPVIDYRKLNAITVRDSFPLPRIDEILQRMQGSRIFSKFDLKMGYNQLRIRDSDRWLTTFMTPEGPWYMNVMTFGFMNAPPYFQRFMHDKVLASVLHQGVENYLNDTNSHHASVPEHIAANRAILQCFCDNNLYCNAKKCDFHKEKIEFLGVDVSQHRFEMDTVKVEAICKWKPPCNMRAVREFIGFCNFYQCFITGFSDIAKPLHDLTGKAHTWQWGEKEQHAFQTLKDRISASTVLSHADPTRPFRMETDMSNHAYGAVLTQRAPDNLYHPIAFFSKSMNPAERNYGISDKEALAIVKALQHWRHWLERTKEPVDIITDHQNLEYFKQP